MVAEAEAAVRRLQAECQHQLELEVQRREALGQATAAAEQRAAAAEAKAAAAERALARHREEHDASEAGRLAAEVAAAQAGLAAAEQRAGKAAEAKRKYKQQVRGGGEVAMLHGSAACESQAHSAGRRQLAVGEGGGGWKGVGRVHLTACAGWLLLWGGCDLPFSAIVSSGFERGADHAASCGHVPANALALIPCHRWCAWPRRWPCCRRSWRRWWA